MTLGIGNIIEDRYELVEELGSGGFATVYQAVQLRTQQLVALKVLHDHRDNTRAERARERFSREMVVVGRLHHPHLVPLIDTGTLENGEPYTVFEFVEGEALSAWIAREGALEPIFFKRIMCQVLEALSCAHERGIVHRDLKPENIMVASTGARRNAVVCDFGIASLLVPEEEEDLKRLTAEGDIAGTPGYMAPEQIHGRDVTPRTDLYAWGLLAYEAYTGQPAVDGDSAMAILLRQSNDEPIVLDGVEDAVLRGILERCTAKEANARYSSAEDVLEELEAWSPPRPPALSFDETIDGSITGVMPPTLTNVPGLVTAEGPLTTTPEPPSRHLHPAIWGGGGLLLGVLVMALAWPSSDAPATPELGASESAPGSMNDVVEVPTSVASLPADTTPDPPETSAAPEPPEVTCGEGMASTPPGSPCCWEGQQWSTTHSACVGKPTCPEFHAPHPTLGCEVINAELWMAHNDCQQGDAVACARLADRFLRGEGVVTSGPRGDAYLLRACELNRVSSCRLLVERDFDLRNPPESHERGMRIAEQLCERGHGRECGKLAWVYRTGRFGRSEDPVVAFELYLRACTAGGSSLDCQKTLQLLDKLPDLPDREAHEWQLLGILCLKKNVKSECARMLERAEAEGNTAEVERILKHACTKTNSGALCLRALPLLERDGVKPLVLRNAADDACIKTTDAAICLKAAELTPHDPSRAQTLYTMACERGSQLACLKVTSKTE